MAWVEAKIKLGSFSTEGMVNDNIVSCPAPQKMEGIDKVSVDGKSYDIVAHSLDKRDNILTIEFAMANSSIKEKSDDKPVERRSKP
jgi:hypothetical protein